MILPDNALDENRRIQRRDEGRNGKKKHPGSFIRGASNYKENV